MHPAYESQKLASGAVELKTDRRYHNSRFRAQQETAREEQIQKI